MLELLHSRGRLWEDVTFTSARIPAINAVGRLFQLRPPCVRTKYRRKLTLEKWGRFACRATTDKARQLRRAKRGTFHQCHGMQEALSARNIS